MAIKFTVKDEPKAAAPVKAARKAEAEIDGNGPAGAMDCEAQPAAAAGTDLFNAEPAEPRKRRKK
jgi:hypothetical protein